jgi:hypothetical protein
MSTIVSFFSSFIGTTHADTEEKAPADEEAVVEEAAEEEEPEDVRVMWVKARRFTQVFDSCNQPFERSARPAPNALL